MSKFMLNDDDAINDVNPFVMHDFSLPGSVKQTGNFADFEEVPPSEGLPGDVKSVYCDYGLCSDEDKPCTITNRNIHPRMNIDYGFTRGTRPTPPPAPAPAPAPTPEIPWFKVMVAIIFIVLALLYVEPE